MCPPPMSRPESEPLDAIFPARSDLIRLLEQKVESGFPPELALDLALHDLVTRSATATGATSAALALVRGEEMVCRAATGLAAPDLGIPLNTRDGLSGACLSTHQPQFCADTESDSRVDSAIARRLGVRSILIVPVLDAGELIGVLEVFSSEPSAFSQREQNLLEASARECTQIRHAAAELGQRPSLQLVSSEGEESPPETPVRNLPVSVTTPTSRHRTQPMYESWTLIVGTLAILATVALSLMIGSRLRWLLPSRHTMQVRIEQPAAPKAANPGAASTVPAEKSTSSGRTRAVASAAPAPAVPSSDELVVYDHGKVIFRVKPGTKQKGVPTQDAPGKATIVPSSNVWLAPDQAETRLLSRIEPRYPEDALANHRSGDVVLEVSVAEDGSVASIRTLTGDPLLATAAADAVRQWRYQPYLLHDRPSPFQTDVTLKFSLPN